MHKISFDTHTKSQYLFDSHLIIPIQVLNRRAESFSAMRQSIITAINVSNCEYDLLNIPLSTSMGCIQAQSYLEVP